MGLSMRNGFVVRVLRLVIFPLVLSCMLFFFFSSCFTLFFLSFFLSSSVAADDVQRKARARRYESIMREEK